MNKCTDNTAIIEFCQNDPIALRHIIHYLNSPIPNYDDALTAFYPGVAPKTPPVIYVDGTNPIRLMAHDWDGRLRLEGNERHLSGEALREWCAQMNPRGAASTSDSLSDLLRETVGQDGWSVNFHYSVSPSKFLERTEHKVIQLSPADYDNCLRFLERPSDTPFLNIKRANMNLARDLSWMHDGLPVDAYAIREGSDIVGICTVFQMTACCDEVSRLYVPREVRGRGYGRSLLSAATRDILARGRQPGFAVGGDPEILGRLLTSLGYNIVCRFWHWRYWWDLPIPQCPPTE